MPFSLTVRFQPPPRRAGLSGAFHLHIPAGPGRHESKTSGLVQDRVTFQLKDLPNPREEALRIESGDFSARFVLEEKDYRALEAGRAEVCLVPDFRTRVIQNHGNNMFRSGERIFVPVFAGDSHFKPRLIGLFNSSIRHLYRNLTDDDYSKEDLFDPVHDGLNWCIAITARQAADVARRKPQGGIFLLPAEGDVCEEYRASTEEDVGRTKLDPADWPFEILGVTIGDKTELYWAKDNRPIHIGAAAGTNPAEHLRITRQILFGDPDKVEWTSGPDGAFTVSLGGTERKLVIDQTHPVYLVMDLGASTHLCGVHLPGERTPTTLVDIGPCGLGKAHVEEETLATVVSVPKGRKSAVSVGNPLECHRGLQFEAPKQDRLLMVATGEADADTARAALSSYPALTDLKWLIHLASGDMIGKLEMGPPTTRSELIDHFVAIVATRCKAAIERAMKEGGVLNTFLAGNENDEKPLLALALAIPGYLRTDVYEALVDGLARLSGELHRQLPAFTDAPELHFGRVYLVPEPFALVEYHRRQLEPDSGVDSLIALDIGMRTFDAAVIRLDGSNWRPERCLSADLGGRAMDYAILAGLRALAGNQDAATRPLIENLLKIDDEEMLRRFGGKDRNELDRGERLLDIVERAKKGFSRAEMLCFDFTQDRAALGDQAVNLLFARLAEQGFANGTAERWTLSWKVLATTAPIVAFEKAVRAVLNDCLLGYGSHSDSSVHVGGRASLFPPMRAWINTALLANGCTRIDWLSEPSASKRNVIAGAAQLASDRTSLLGKMETSLHLLQLDVQAGQARTHLIKEGDFKVKAEFDGTVLVVAMGPAMAKAVEESADPLALCRTFFQDESLSKRLSVRKGAELQAEVVRHSVTGRTEVLLGCDNKVVSYSFLSPGGIFA